MKTVYDIGMYDAADTRYFLESGFNVVAIEANPALIDRARSSLESYLQSGQLHLVNAAVGATEESVKLTVCGDDLGSSSILQEMVAARNPIGVYTVPGISLQKLFQEHGVPHYLKIDIEGADKECVRSITAATKPEFLSFEVDDCLEETIAYASSVGFTRFKIINQCNFRELSNQNSLYERAAHKLMRLLGYAEPRLVKRAGRWFACGHSSGPAPWCSDGRWSSLDKTLHKWKQARKEDRLWGWYDLHAT